MIRIVVLSDTHVPRRARDLPAVLWQAIDSADVVFHAGDWVDVATLDAIASRARRLVGVAGNNDGVELHDRLPELARVDLEEMRVEMIHDSGPAAGREARADRDFPHADLLIFGHSHIPWDTRSPAGLRLVNPGSPTDRRRQPAGTFVTADVVGSRLENVTFVSLPPHRHSQGAAESREKVAQLIARGAIRRLASPCHCLFPDTQWNGHREPSSAASATLDWSEGSQHA